MEEKIKDFEILLNKNIEFWESAKNRAEKELEENESITVHKHFCDGCLQSANHIKEIFESVFNKA